MTREPFSMSSDEFPDVTDPTEPELPQPDMELDIPDYLQDLPF